MTFRTRAPAIAAAALLLSAPAAAVQLSPQQAASADPRPAADPAQPCCTIPALTVVEVEIADDVNSKTAHPGDRFALRLAEPLEMNERVLLPAGTPGIGEVVHAAKAGGMGKAGELILAARYLDYRGQHIPLRSLRYGRSHGKDRSGTVTAGNIAAAAVLPLASVAGFFISGGNVDIPAGTRATAKVSAETILAPSP